MSPRTPTPRLDLAAAYAATLSRLLGWLVVAAAVYRHAGPGPFAVLMLARGTLAIFNHAAFGLGPAVLTEATRAGKAVEAEAVNGGRSAAAAAALTVDVGVLDYAKPERTAPPLIASADGSPAAVLWSAVPLTFLLGVTGYVALTFYSSYFRDWHDLPPEVVRSDLDGVFLLGVGVILRAAGDAGGGGSQGVGWLAADQAVVTLGELLWVIAGVGLLLVGGPLFLDDVGSAYAVSGAVACGGRWLMALIVTGGAGAFGRWLSNEIRGRSRPRLVGLSSLWRRLLWTGSLVTVAGLADYLYAPIDYVVLNAMVDPLAPAVYAPAVQVDAAVLILTTAVATVALPNAARLHAAGDHAGVWRAYVRGSLLAGGVALAAAVPAWLLAPWAFEAWLGEPQPATVTILPLVLVHTVLGSAAGVGRAVLVGVGRAGQYALLVLAGGVVNVGASVGFVLLGWGIAGVVAGTVLSVALRCLVATPLLVRRATAKTA